MFGVTFVSLLLCLGVRAGDIFSRDRGNITNYLTRNHSNETTESLTEQKIKVESMDTIFSRKSSHLVFHVVPLEKKLLCPVDEVYDKKANKCRRTISPIYIGIKRIPHQRTLVMVHIAEKDLLNKTCKNPRKYYSHEYTINNQSAVTIKKTGEVLQMGEYYVNKTTSAVSVCHHWPNCSGQWLTVKQGEFTLFANQSVFVHDSERVYDKSEYVWYNDTIIVCSYLNDTQLNTSCVGDWVLIENDEFQVLENKSIYVNTSKMLFKPPEYIWQDRKLIVCMKFSDPSTMTKAIANKNDVLPMLTLVGMSLSIISLVFVLITYSLFAELRTPPGINLMNLSASILLAQFLWLVGSGQTDKPMACTAIAVLLHYLFLVSFAWTAIIAFDTWRAFTAKGARPLRDSKRKRLIRRLRYMAVGWLSVMVYVAICVALDQTNTVQIGYGSDDACWIADNHAKLFFFGIPVGLVMIFNIVFFSLTVKAIKQTQNQTNLANENTSNKRDFGVYVRIASVMGFTWAFGFAAPFGWLFLIYVFVILNSLQGVYIAVAFALSKRARNLYIKLCCPKKPSPKDDSIFVSTRAETVGQSADEETAV